MSIRKRLTLWYAFILIAAFTLFGAAVYFVVWFTLTREIDEQLFATAVTITDQSRPALDNGQLVASVPPLDIFRNQQVYVEVLDTEIAIRDSNMPGYREVLDKAALDAIAKQPLEEKQLRWSQSRHSSAELRVLTVPLIAPIRKPGRDGLTKELLGYMQLGSSLEDVQRVTNSLLVALVGVGTLAVVIASGAGMMMSRRALKPVDDITRTALKIYRAENLDQRVTVTSTDEVGRLGSAFNEMLGRLSELFKSQQRLVGDVSHELRTPLTVIRGNADLMRAMGCGDEESLDAITSETDRMTRMVGNLLLLSQADAGQLPMKVAPIDMVALVSEVGKAGPMMSNGRVSVAAIVDPSANNFWVEGDRDRLKQVLLNLVDNAIKHTPDGGEVTVRAAADDDSVRVSVSDTGAGIPPEDLPHVFERFYRVDKARSREVGGAGLGLAIVKSITEAHGGSLDARSELGKGSTFIVCLPRFHPNLV